MKKALALSLGAALLLVGCTCPVCQGSGLQTVVSIYEKTPGGKQYKETATVKCGGCWGSGRNWGSMLGFLGFSSAALHTADHAMHTFGHHHHGPAMPPPPPHHGRW